MNFSISQSLEVGVKFPSAFGIEKSVLLQMYRAYQLINVFTCQYHSVTLYFHVCRKCQKHYKVSNCSPLFENVVGD